MPVSAAGSKRQNANNAALMVRIREENNWLKAQ
jgi:hypothetical protein